MRDLPEDLDDRATALLSRVVPGGFVPPPFRIWAQSIDLAEHVEPLGKYCREESALSPAARELVILLAAERLRSPGAWQAHADKALAAGLPRETLDALASGTEPALPDAELSATYRLADRLLAARGVDDETFDRARDALGTRGIVDLIGCLGSFAMSAWALNAFRMGFDDAAAWPFEQPAI
ncbi:carboxymuconolactone decarboxylase family protein [Microbacterium sp. PRC9]|uniref:carboxymuconolactone decarboxylase family protein n=1 Tax=Microbacterium sp. PRC9 TaxID=2962591 RepID=UPI002882CAF3|nr:carboxymuconolactone decarboxylase family protein [Microbacterium sp. PRC9]MDT0144531.1 carboxymuconolactone decarboxylase family protein [Microbacterium sp. PRC9]